jgi:hypothetical protein
MIFTWLKQRRRRRILAAAFPADWERHLQRHVWPDRYLAAAERAQLRGCVQVLVAEKNWEGCGGLEMTDEVRVTVAGLASVLLLGLEHDYFSHVQSILVYPSGYTVPARLDEEHPVIDVEGEPHLGEAWYRGPVVLSWAEVKEDAAHPQQGSNLVWHEFAHQLDMLDRSVNGTPPLASREARREWHEVMTAEFERLGREARAGRETLLDPYGAQDEAEFFAVASESFFSLPHALRREHPRLYAVLREYYRQDPAERQPEMLE